MIIVMYLQGNVHRNGLQQRPIRKREKLIAKLVRSGGVCGSEQTGKKVEGILGADWPER